MAKREKDAGREQFLALAAQAYDEWMRCEREQGDETFDEMEEAAEELGYRLIRQLLATRLAALAEDEPEAVSCPNCGGRMRRPPKPLGRGVVTKYGEVRYERRHAMCDRCGASFSPSGPSTEDSGGPAVEPLSPDGL